MFSIGGSSIQLFFSVPQWSSRKYNLGFFFHPTRKIGFISCTIASSSSSSSSPGVNDDSVSNPKQTQLDYDASGDLFRLTEDRQQRNVISEAPKTRSWFGPNGQYIRELPCPSCRGRGYTPCVECGIEISRIDCTQCNGKGIRTCNQCLGDCVIWEESIDEQPWEKARSISPLKVKEDDEVDNLDIKFDVRKRSKRVYQSPPPEVGLKISRALKSLNAKTGLFSKRMKILHQDPVLHAQRVAAMKQAKGTPEARKRVSDALIAYFSDPQNRQKRSISMKGAKYHCGICGEEGHRRYHCPELKKAGVIVNTYRCGLCKEMGHNRRSCPKSKSSEPKRRNNISPHCLVCGQSGHRRYHCPELIKAGVIGAKYHCGNCGEAGHRRFYCPELKRAGAIDMYRCGLCNEMGHNRRRCPKPKSSEPKRRNEISLPCRACGQRGHRRYHCPKLKKAGVILSRHSCGLCKEVGHNRRSCPKSKSSEPKRRNDISRNCRVCGQSGHNSRTCARGIVVKQVVQVPALAKREKKKWTFTPEVRISDARKTYYSDSKNHEVTPEARKRMSDAKKRFYSDPENRRKRSIIALESKYHCGVCGKEGHKKHYCPELIKAGTLSSIWRCRLCNETGHNRLACPNSKSKEGLISS